MAKAKKRVTTRKRARNAARQAPSLGERWQSMRSQKKRSPRFSARAEREERAAKKQRPKEAVETTKIDVIDEAAPGVISVKEYDSVRMATSIRQASSPSAAKASVLRARRRKLKSAVRASTALCLSGYARRPADER